MPSFGYYVYLVRAAKPFNPAQSYRLNEVGDAGDDLLSTLHDRINGLGLGYHSQSGTAEGYRLKENVVRGRTLWVRVNRGPEGFPGETYDRDLNVGSDTTDRVALLSGIRAMFALPADSYLGLLFLEKVGVRNLKDLLSETATKPSALVTGSHITLESFAEISDWRRELDPLSAVRISESLTVRDSGEDASTREDTVVQIVAEGARVRHATERVKDIIYGRLGRRDERLSILQRTGELGERRRQAEADGVSFQDESEYQSDLERLRDLNQKDEFEPELANVLSQVVPVDRASATHKSFRVGLGEDRPQRNILIEGNSVPLFKYELGARLPDRGLRHAWVAHAETILRNRRIALPSGWATGNN